MADINENSGKISKIMKKSHIIIAVSILVAVMIIIGIVANRMLYKKGKADNSSTLKTEYASMSRDTIFSVDGSGKLQITRERVEDKTENMEDSWTVLMYMTATDLESKKKLASRELKKIKKGLNISEEAMKNFNFVIETGGCKSWSDNLFPNDKLCRVVLTGQGNYEIIETQELKSMGDPETLAEFVKWGETKYPAKHTMLVLWDHGGKENDVCYDDLFDYDCLTMNEIEYALAKSKESMVAPFDVVVFNTCSSGTVEVANSLVPYANYMIATPSYKASVSYDYIGTFNKMINNPESSAETICKTFMDGTYNKFFRRQDSELVWDYRYMVYNLQELDNFLVELNSVFKKIYELATQGKKQLKLLNKIDRKTFRYQNGVNIDLGDYLKRIYKKTDIDTTACKEALDKVTYISIGGIDAGSSSYSGLAFHHPFGTTNIRKLNNYRNKAVSPYYLKYLERTFHAVAENDFNNFKEYAWESSPYFHEDNFNFINYMTEYYAKKHTNDEIYAKISQNSEYASAGFVKNWYDNLRNIPLTDREEFSDIEIAVTKDTYNAKITQNPEYVNTVYNSVFAKLDDRLVCLGENGKATYDETTGEIISNFKGEWLMLGDGQLLTTYVEQIGEDYIQYSIPVYIDDKEASIYITENSEGITIQGVGGATKYSNIYNPIEELTSGTIFTPIYDVWDDDSNTYNTEIGEEYTYKEDNDFLYTMLKDSEYIYSFIVEDASGYKSYSKQQPFTVKDEVLVTKE